MPWVATALAVASTVNSIAGGLSAKDAAEKAGEKQAEAILRQNKENKRRRLLDFKQNLGEIDAKAYASNLQMTGSTERYKKFYASEYQREMTWDDSKARMDARNAQKGAAAVGESALYSGIGSALGSAGKAASVWGQ
jgi:hypothetical protein